MSDYEEFKKNYLEKFQENSKLQEELKAIKEKTFASLLENQNVYLNVVSPRSDFSSNTQSFINKEENFTNIKQEEQKFTNIFSKLKNSHKSKNEIDEIVRFENSENINKSQNLNVSTKSFRKNNQNNNKSEKTIDMGMIYDEALFKEKHKGNNNMIQVDYQEYEKLKFENEEMKTKIISNQNEIKELKENFDKEISAKSEIYSQSLEYINKTHMEETKKLRIDYESKMDQLIQISEEEKLNLIIKIKHLEKEIGILENKLSSSSERVEKSKLIEIQKNYINEMKSIEKVFQEYQEKKIKEIEKLNDNKKKLEIIIKNEQAKIKKIEHEFKVLHDDYENNISSIQIKYENDLKKLKAELSNTQEEKKFLEIRIFKLEENEKKNQRIIQDLNKKNSTLNEKVYNIRSISENERKYPILSQNSLMRNVQNKNLKVIESIDLENAREKIKEMEECLKILCKENEKIKKKYEVVKNLEEKEDKSMLISFKSNGESKVCIDSRNNAIMSDKTDEFDSILFRSIKKESQGILNITSEQRYLNIENEV